MKKSGVLLTVLMLARLGGADLVGADGLALPEVILPQIAPYLKDALTRSPRLLNRQLELEMAENDRIAARAGMLPVVGGSYRDVQAQDDRADVAGALSARKVYYDISVTQPLYYWGERRNNLRMAEIKQKMTEGQFRDAYRMLATEIRFQYLHLVVQKLRLIRTRSENERAIAAVRTAEEQLAAQRLAEADLIGPRLRAESVAIELERSEFEFEGAKRGFGRLTGMAPPDDAGLPDEIPVVNYAASTYDRMLAAYLAGSEFPTLSAFLLRQDIAIERLNYQNQKVRLRPKLNLVAGLTQDEQSYTLNTAQKFAVDSRYVGIGVTWPIFDSFASRSAVRNALGVLRQKESAYAQLTQDLAEQAQSQGRLIYFAARSMSIADRQLALAREWVTLRVERLGRGEASASDVDNARIALLDATINACNVRIDFLARVTDFLGTLDQDPVTANLPAFR